MESVVVRIVAPRLLRGAFEALVAGWEGFEVARDSGAVTLVAGAAWREEVGRRRNEGALALLAWEGDFRDALRLDLPVIVGDDEPSSVLRLALEAAARGEPFWSPRVVSLARRPEAPCPRLTARQEQVAQLVLEGCTDKEIAARLRLSIHSVKSHLRRGSERLGVSRRSELARFVAH